MIEPVTDPCDHPDWMKSPYGCGRCVLIREGLLNATPYHPRRGRIRFR